MRIADILETIKGKGYYKRRDLVLPKHVDFLICDRNFKPVLAIELDGKSHQRKDRIERDILIDQIFEDVDLKLERILR